MDSRSRRAFDLSPGSLEDLSIAEIVAVCCSLVLMLVSVALSLLFWIRRVRLRRLGPYGEAVRLIVEAHAKGRKAYGDSDGDARRSVPRNETLMAEAGAMYREAIMHICSPAFSKAPATSTGNAVQRLDKILTAYNGEVGLGAAVALAFRTQSEEGTVGALLSCVWAEQLDAEVDETRSLVRLAESICVAESGIRVGDKLVTLNNDGVTEMSADTIHKQFASPGRATFQRDAGGDANNIVVCSRCASRNTVEDACVFFKCYSCFAVVVPWDQFMQAAEATPKPQRFTCSSSSGSKARPKRLFPSLQDIDWETSGLGGVLKHPMGFGVAYDLPTDCQHHTQVGAQCGLAAVNNVLTNSGQAVVTAEQMVAISSRLGQAEIAIRDGTSSVEESGQQQSVAELYATSGGGHFDVQTLQMTFEELGFQMRYVMSAKPEEAQSFFDKEGLLGYIVHRKDPISPTRDHWFVVRPHGLAEVLFLLQDSLYEKVFKLTRTEVQQLLLNLPPGSLFAVTRAATEGP
eukprot:TRINITY_DN81998_c0_g1_i1.p1 TRINITY_DN81998_c0_g1~~TRINITY_DN81998_c0_g1_i1.p1  ORF type:complete len:517 (+),score=85.33 TRINITY_DN81998_c0_g1_i1:119-1669(+)